MSENLLPRGRHTGIVEQSLDGEILIYDLEIHKAYNLNKTLAAVYEACDGITSYDELKRRHHLTGELIDLALDQLKENNLLEPGYSATPLKGITRREVIRRAGLASLIALPLITTLAAPGAAAASSLTAAICTTGSGITCSVSNDCGGYCDTSVVNQCQCVLNCCVECNFSVTSAICAGVCLETATDPNNCGGCGVVCPSGNCVGGLCVPPPV